MRDGRDDIFDSSVGVKNIDTIDTYRHAFESVSFQSLSAESEIPLGEPRTVGYVACGMSNSTSGLLSEKVTKLCKLSLAYQNERRFTPCQKKEFPTLSVKAV